MKLLFKQCLFSWFDSYDIYDQAGTILYVVKGQFAQGHCLKIYDALGALMLVLAIDAEKCSRN